MKYSNDEIGQISKKLCYNVRVRKTQFILFLEPYEEYGLLVVQVSVHAKNSLYRRKKVASKPVFLCQVFTA